MIANQLIDLNRIKADDLEEMIIEECGGKYSFFELIRLRGTGLAGLNYQSGILHNQPDSSEANILEPYRSNIELLKNGIGLYLQRRNNNFLLLIPKDKLERIFLEKTLEASDNSGSGRSSTSLLSSLKQKMKLDPYLLHIHLFSGERITFVLMLKSKKQLEDFFSKSFLPRIYEDLTGLV